MSPRIGVIWIRLVHWINIYEGICFFSEFLRFREANLGTLGERDAEEDLGREEAGRLRCLPEL